MLTDAADSPHLPFLREAGVELTVVDPASSARVLAGGGTWFAPTPALLDALAGQSGVEVVVGSVEPPGARLLDVWAVMDRLRSPGGCPWDAKQTHASLLPYLLEEAYEACAAIEDGDLAGLREELGDVLLQVVFHARLAQEQAGWSIDEVAGDLVDKLVRRHPHVFAGAAAGDVEGSWEALKQAEKRRTSVTDGVPLGQPALALAAKLQSRASRLGVPTIPGSVLADGLGAALWDLVASCLESGVDPEAALRAAARVFRDRLAAAEAQALHAGVPAAERWSSLFAR